MTTTSPHINVYVVNSILWLHLLNSDALMLYRQAMMLLTCVMVNFYLLNPKSILKRVPKDVTKLMTLDLIFSIIMQSVLPQHIPLCWHG